MGECGNGRVPSGFSILEFRIVLTFTMVRLEATTRHLKKKFLPFISDVRRYKNNSTRRMREPGNREWGTWPQCRQNERHKCATTE